MKSFFIKSSLLFLLFYSLLFVFQCIVDHGLRMTYDKDFSDWNKVFEGKINVPMVFLGSSRAEAHFDPNIIEQKTGISCYNLGVSGASFVFQQMRWKSYLANNIAPKIVIQSIDLYAMTERKTLPGKHQYLPYYDEPAIFDGLEKIDKSILIEKWVPMSKYRGYEPQIIKGLKAYFGKKYTNQKIKGYRRHTESWNKDFDLYKKTLKGNKIDFKNINFFRNFTALYDLIKDCEKTNTKLILVWTPSYFELNHLQEPMLTNMKKAIIKIAAQKRNITFMDFTNDYLNRDTKYFYNSYHMNQKGVAIFCDQFSDSLKLCLKKNPLELWRNETKTPVSFSR